MTVFICTPCVSAGSLLTSDAGAIPAGNRWWNYLYCSCVLAFCLFVCIIGGAMFARTSVFILLVSHFLLTLLDLYDI